MKNLLNKYMMAAVVVLGCVMTATAQRRAQDERVRISNLEVERVGGDNFGGGEVWVSFRADVAKSFGRNAIMSLTPLLFTESDEAQLPEVWVMARRGEILLEREGEWLATEDMIVRPGGTIGYKFSMPYENWMNHSSLRILKSTRYCNEFFQMPSEMMLYDITLAEDMFDPYYALAAPRSKSKKGDKVKGKCTTGSLFLDFGVSSAKILEDFSDNSMENKKLHRALGSVADMNRIEKIELWGTCSPEGGYGLNTQLAEDRVEAVKNYIMQEFAVPENKISVSSTPEDWDGLLKIVKKSNLANKAQIIKIINSKMSYADKDAAMRKLSNYQMLLRNYYPQLRKVDFNIVPKKMTCSDAQLAEMFLKDPDKLSKEQLYRLAANNGTLFESVVKYTVDKYPKSASANINMTVVCLVNDELSMAETYLNKAAASLEIIVKTPTPKLVATYYNTAAILQLKRGDVESAELLFGKGAVMGLDEARKNLEIMEGE